MKKVLLVVLVLAAFSQAKAQQLFQFKPADSLNSNLLQKYLDLKPNAQQQLFQPRIVPDRFLAAANTQIKVSACDRMPIVNFAGFSKMPVVKLEGTDKMPILKLGNGAPVEPEGKKLTP